MANSNRIALAIILALVAIALVVAPSLANAQTVPEELQECSQLKDLEDDINVDDLVDGVSGNPDEPNYNFKKEGYYFCGEKAPAYLRCKCGIASVCHDKNDPWGRNMGECGCCTNWVIILFCVFIFVVLLVLIGGIYACMCHGTWMYDGFPHPIMPLLPQRSATIIAPASFPLPEHAFRPFRSSDFISSDDHTAVAAAIAAAALEPPTEGVRRRRGGGRSRGNAANNAGGEDDGLAVPMTAQQQQQQNPRYGRTAAANADNGLAASPNTEARRPLMAASPLRDALATNRGNAVGPSVPLASGNASSASAAHSSHPSASGVIAGLQRPVAFTPTNSDDGRAPERRPPPQLNAHGRSAAATNGRMAMVVADDEGLADDLDFDPSL